MKLTLASKAVSSDKCPTFLLTLIKLAVDPKDVISLNDLGKYNEAISYYDNALAIEPNNAEALHDKSLALGKLLKSK